MGEIVFAAKVTHVPSIWMSEMYEQHKGIRDNAINGLVELGKRANSAGVDTFAVIDTHWIVNQGFHLNAAGHHADTFTSHELPHFLEDMEYAYDGDPELGTLMADTVREADFRAMAHDTPNLKVEYGTLIPMRHMMNTGAYARVLPIAANQFASIDEGRRMGEAMRDAIEKSDRKVGLIASGSLSHQFFPNDQSEAGAFETNTEFNRQVDLRVLELWETGQIKEFIKMLPDYAARCAGECQMIDTAMLLGALGWNDYSGKAELLGEYFGSSGTGQANLEFAL